MKIFESIVLEFHIHLALWNLLNAATKFMCNLRLNPILLNLEIYAPMEIHKGQVNMDRLNSRSISHIIWSSL